MQKTIGVRKILDNEIIRIKEDRERHFDH